MKVLASGWNGWNATGIAPHTATVRITIAPPQGQKYHFTNCSLYMYRSTAATTDGYPRVYVTVQRGTGPECITFYRILKGAGVGNTTESNITLDFTVTYGDTVRVYSEDPSTGGAVDYKFAITYEQIA